MKIFMGAAKLSNDHSAEYCFCHYHLLECSKIWVTLEVGYPGSECMEVTVKKEVLLFAGYLISKLFLGVQE